MFEGEKDKCWVPAKKIFEKGSGKDEDNVVAPYWAVDFAKDEEKPNMSLKPVTLKLGKLGEVTGISKSDLTLPTPGGAQGNGLLTIYALTNTKRVKVGDVLLRKQT